MSRGGVATTRACDTCVGAPWTNRFATGFSAVELPDFNQPNLRLLAGDITRLGKFAPWHGGLFASLSSGRLRQELETSYEPYLQNNVQGLCNVCSVARELGVQKLVWTSTMLTFGPTAPGEVGDETRRRDHLPIFTAYERSKLAAEAEAENLLAMARHW